MSFPVLANPLLYTSQRDSGPDAYGMTAVEIVKSAPVNAFYGHSSIIRRYCGYPMYMPLPFIVQHGTVGFSQDFYELRDWFKHERLTNYWSWNHRALDYATQVNSKFSVEILGSPFLYLVRMIRQLINITENKPDDGCPLPRLDEFKAYLLDVKAKRLTTSSESKYKLVFAPHSIPSCALPYSAHLAFARHLDENLNLSKAVVCMHPFDVFLGNHRAYQDSAFNVVSCMNSAIPGYPWNEREFWESYHKIGVEYLVNLYGLIVLASSVYSCGLSTPLFYAGYLKKKCKLLHCPPVQDCDPFVLIRDIINTNKPCELDLAACNTLSQALDINTLAPFPMNNFNEYCRLVLGADHMISAHKMLKKLNRTWQFINV